METKNKSSNGLKIALISILALVMSWGIIHFIPSSKVVEENHWLRGDRSFISAHRGGSELNPENTEMAFDYIIKETTYTDIVEFDIRITKDNKYVITHDATLNRMALEKGTPNVTISETNYAELLNYNLGKNFKNREGKKPYENITIEEADNLGLTILTLEEFLTKYKEVRDFKILLEFKDKGEKTKIAADKVYEMLNNEEYYWWKDRTMIISFEDELIDYISNTYPDLYVSPLGNKIVPQYIFQTLGMDCLVAPKYQCFSTSMSNSIGPIKIDCATKAMIDGVHKRNQSITYWTINNENDMQKLMDLGADIITTNAPDKMARVQGLI